MTSHDRNCVADAEMKMLKLRDMKLGLHRWCCKCDVKWIHQLDTPTCSGEMSVRRGPAVQRSPTFFVGAAPRIYKKTVS